MREVHVNRLIPGNYGGRLFRMNNSHRHDWVTARQRIQQRMAELRLSNVDLARASGLSEKHVRTLVNDGSDVSVPRDQTRWALCDALQWTPDSLDRILDGDEPVEAGDESGDVSRLDLLDGRLAEIEALATTGLAQLRNQQDEMAKFWRLLRQLEGELRSVEVALVQLREAQRPGDAGPP